MRDMPAIGAAADPDRGTRALSGLRTAFSRIMAVVLFIFAIAVWGRIAGLPFGEPFSAIDTAPRIWLGIFAALLPLAGQGLWLEHAWGRVLWLAAVALHVAAIANGWWPAGWSALALLFHAVTVGLFAALEIAALFDHRRRRRARTR